MAARTANTFARLLPRRQTGAQHCVIDLGTKALRGAVNISTMAMKNNIIVVIGLALLALLWLAYYGGKLTFVVDVSIQYDNGSAQRKQQLQGNEAPILILHVGPPNTNGTVMQEFAASHEEELQKDNFYYVGDQSSDDLYHSCFMISNTFEETCTRAWQEFGRTLQYHYERHHNVLVSNEWLGALYSSRKDAETNLWDPLLCVVQNWDVRVVYTYRRLHEWLPNHYPHMTPNFKVKSPELWPDHGGIEIPSFPDVFDRTLQMAYMQPPELLKQWQLRFDNVTIWNTHAPGNLIGNFFCHQVPEATRVCATFLPLNDTRVEHRNFTDDFQFDLLSVAAYKKGLVNDTLSRTFVSNAAQQYGTMLRYKRKKEYPLKCPSQEQLDEMLRGTIEMERAMLPEFYASEYGETYLKLEFGQSSRKRLQCSFDVDAILSDPRWKSFFKSLGRQPLPWESLKSLSEISVPPDYNDLDVDIKFLGIGAQGAGTTWLADVFRLCCPQIDFGTRKEKHFWDKHRFNGLKWYSDQFPRRHKKKTPKMLQGEITPHYLGLPDEDISEILLLFPNVTIFFVARNLVDRAWSHVRKNLRKETRNGMVTSTDASDYKDYYFMKKLEDGCHEERSNYEKALRRWYKHFPDEQILILNYEDIKKDPVRFVLQVLDHVGLNTGDINVSAIQQAAVESVNSGQDSILRPSLRKQIEDLHRPHVQAFNRLLEEKGYTWRLEDYSNSTSDAMQE